MTPTDGSSHAVNDGSTDLSTDLAIDAARAAEWKTRYAADGFLVVPEPILPAEIIRRAIDGMDALRRGVHDTGRPPAPSGWNPGDDPNRLCKIEQPQLANTAIRELVAHPAIGRLAAAVTGARTIQVWWVQLLYKPPAAGESSAGTHVGWHQDRSYWDVWEDGSELLTAWVALSDVREESGPMRFLRGSHRWGIRRSGDFFEQNLERQRASLDLPDGAAWEEVSARLPPGGVSLHHCLTYHASGANRSPEPRRSFALHLRTERSRPVDDLRRGLAAFIDDAEICPIYRREEGPPAGSMQT